MGSVCFGGTRPGGRRNAKTDFGRGKGEGAQRQSVHGPSQVILCVVVSVFQPVEFPKHCLSYISFYADCKVD